MGQKMISTRDSGVFIKIVAIFCLILLSIALLMAWKSPTTSYEPSIYTATPIFFWVVLLINLVSGISIVTLQVYNGQHFKSKLWIIGLFLIICVFISILSLWIIRGYLQYGLADTLTHKALTDDILTQGKFSGFNIYPISHIFLSEAVLISNQPVVELMKLIPIVFEILYLGFMYVLLKSIISSKGAVLLALVAATTILSSWGGGFTPNMLANLYLPFVIFLLVKSTPPDTLSWKICFVIVMFLLPVFHPVPTLELLVIMITATLPQLILAIVKKRSLGSLDNVFSFRLPATLFLLVWAVIWFSYRGPWNQTINSIITIIRGEGTSHLSELNQQIQYAQEFRYSVVSQFFMQYGVTILYLIIATATFFVLYKKFAERERSNLLSLFGPMATTGAIILLFFGFSFFFSPLRMITYLLLFCLIISGYGLFKLIDSSYLFLRLRMVNLVFSLLVIIVLSAAFISGAVILYPSRFTLAPNDQVTRTVVNGARWFFDEKNLEMPNTGLLVQLNRLADYLLTPNQESAFISGEIKADLNTGLEQLRDNQGPMPWHFNYNVYTSLGDWYPQNSYLVITQQDRLLYEDVYPEMQTIRFTKEDFNRIEQDASVDKLYTNGGMDIYNITRKEPVQP
jgi:hypothetical protein